MINVLSKFNFQVLLERATAFCSKELFNPNGGGVHCAHTFSDGYFSMEKRGLEVPNVTFPNSL